MRKENRESSPCLPRTCSHQCAACQQEHCSCQQHRPRRAHAASSSAPGSVVSAAAPAAWLSCLVCPACACCMTSSRHKALHVGVCCKDPHPEGCCLLDLPVLPACVELVDKLDRKAWAAYDLWLRLYHTAAVSSCCMHVCKAAWGPANLRAHLLCCCFSGQTRLWLFEGPSIWEFKD